MKPLKIKDRCTKKRLSKCDDVARLYDKIQIAYADVLEADKEVKKIICNMPLQDFPEGEYSSDFVCEKTNGDYIVRECVWRKNLTLPRTAQLLDASRTYWLKRGVDADNWAIITESVAENDESK